MATPAAGQEETAPPAPPSPLDEDMKTRYTPPAEDDVLGIKKEPVASTHVESSAGQEDPASPGREPILTEGTSGHVEDSSQKSNEAPSSLMSEISSLRDKLRFLEERVGQASDRSDIKQDRQIVDERQLRKQIRRARDHVNQGDEEEGEGEEKFNAPVLKLNLNPVEWGEFRASRKTVLYLWEKEKPFITFTLVGSLTEEIVFCSLFRAQFTSFGSFVAATHSSPEIIYEYRGGGV
ncbi:hypothetical protein FOYG_15244 [Fusarium oxysporum NRRL 32931]|uniref:Uncharacterized protein n=1 Tax=Fusarium oxysporum NRRL 32931 TaxID=660029 RepID=W9HLA8_FUSOX|nr:hypothetical protein FOYG_15244 [Fusarium oxysporum NRRL 32931]